MMTCLQLTFSCSFQKIFAVLNYILHCTTTTCTKMLFNIALLTLKDGKTRVIDVLWMKFQFSFAFGGSLMTSPLVIRTNLLFMFFGLLRLDEFRLWWLFLVTWWWRCPFPLELLPPFFWRLFFWVSFLLALCSLCSWRQ